MSVNHSLLPISESDLESLLKEPSRIQSFIESHDDDMCRLWTDGIAIISLTATGDDCPLRFMQSGAREEESGLVGDEEDPDADMGYGPASYYRNRFLVTVAELLQPWTREVFTNNCDVDWLDENDIYPGGWRNEGRREALIDAFGLYRDCVLSAATSGNHLLVWND